jgi:hypothetical protein
MKSREPRFYELTTLGDPILIYPDRIPIFGYIAAIGRLTEAPIAILVSATPW